MISLLLGFSSSTSNFCQSLFEEGIREVITSESKILFREVGNVKKYYNIIKIIMD